MTAALLECPSSPVQSARKCESSTQTKQNTCLPPVDTPPWLDHVTVAVEETVRLPT